MVFPALLLALPLSAASFHDRVDARAFVKGQLHSHSDRSDGDAPPAEVAAWYADHGFTFLALTDHDRLTTLSSSPLTLIPGVEVTSHGAKKPVHVNALCGSSALKGADFPTGAAAVRDAVVRSSADGAFTLVNHPYWTDALTGADLLAAPPFDALEIASAHPLVGQAAEPLWQWLLDQGRFVYAAAVDDAHDFRGPGEGRKPGGAWIEAWDTGSDAAGTCAALRAGRFYATTGVRLSALTVAADRISLSIDALPKGAAIEFLGARGKVLARASSSPAEYVLRGGESYVRARVTFPDGRKAWTQAYRAD
jgi:hypothetical protein